MSHLADLGALPRAEGDETALGTSRYILPPGIRENLEASLADPPSVFDGDDEDDGPRGGQDGLARAELDDAPAHSRYDYAQCSFQCGKSDEDESSEIC